MPRKRAAPPPEPVSSTRGRGGRKSTAKSAPPPKKGRSPEPESESDSDEDFEEATTSQPPPAKKGKKGPQKKPAPKSKRNINYRDESEEEEEEEDEEEEKDSSPERAPPPVTKKTTAKNQNTPKATAKKTTTKKKKKKETSESEVSRDPSPEPPPPPPPKPEPAKKGRKPKNQTPAKAPRAPPPRRKKAVVVVEEEEEETPLQKKKRIRAERKARRIEEAKTRPKLTLLEKLEKIKKKKERRERRRERDREESMRQKYGQRKLKAEASKWNFGPISSINQRRRDEMMEFFPQADFSSTKEGIPKVMHNFRKATVKYNMEVLNPFITCGICSGYIIDATTIIDCMHTFCKSCLLVHFESDKNTSCPTCDTFIHGSHPLHYVYYDRAFNDLINQFVPNLEKTELEARRKFLRDCREAIGIDTAAEDRERAERIERERVTGHNRCYPAERPRFSHHRDDCQVVVNLLPGTGNLPLISRPFIKCSEMTTMNTLKKYISLQIWDEQSRYSDLDMFCDGQLMGKDFSIRFVWMMKRRGQPKGEPLIIRYHMSRTD